jgi:ribosome biogenesis GTPase
MKGKVIKSTGSWYNIIDDNNTIHRGRLRGKFRNLDLKVTNPIAVGDDVVFETDQESENSVIITEIQPRKNEILRRSSRKSVFAHTLAANLDQVVIIFTLKKPRTSTGFLDRFLVLSEFNNIKPLICFHKTDLLNQRWADELNHLDQLYQGLGYTTIQTSIEDNNSLENLKKLLNNKTSLFAGHSGTGKSTIINHFNPNLDIRTDIISKRHSKGQHTTTHAEIFSLWDNTFGIDSPGIKELGFYDLPKDQLRFCFPEFVEAQKNCNFSDCLHENEPDCRVKDLLIADKISMERFDSYLSMLEELKGYKE